MSKNNNVELLAPAGDFNAMKVAIGNGANSIYFGSNYFNARKKAKNISEEEIEAAIDYAHIHSCKAYLTLNTLLLDDELNLATDLAKLAYSYGIDAIIVQDLGFAANLKKEIPGIVIHASTQATIYDEYAIDACACIGFSRIILPRELSIPEIARLSAYAKTKGIETEVFVHGALCVSYSGQCLMSSMIGGRSGNRGECAQPCRLSYDVTVAKRPKNSSSPHLATKDLSAIENVEQLIKAGVSAFKIEGRMRSPEYVGIATREFYKQIKFVQNKIKFDNFEPSLKGLEKGNIENLLLAFNRGGNFTNHYLAGKKSPDMIAGNHVGSFGVFLGEIAAKNSQIGVIEVRKTSDVTATQFPEKGDVIAIRRAGNEVEIASAPIGSAVMNGFNVRIKGFHPAMIDILQIGDQVYRMSNTPLSKDVVSSNMARTYIEGVLSENEKQIILKWEVTEGIAKGVFYEEIFEKALNGFDNNSTEKSQTSPSPISEDRCREQLSKTGGTPFAVSKIDVLCLPEMPISALNSLRRESLEGLTQKIKDFFKKSLSVYEDEDINIKSKYEEEDITIKSNTEIEKSTEFKDYSAVEAIIEQMDILTGDISNIKLTQNEDSTSDSELLSNGKKITKHQVSAYYYYWDGNADSITCKSDWYELPIWAFYNENAFKGINKLKQIEPDARIAVVLPPAYIGKAHLEILKIISVLSENEYIDAIVSGNPGNGWLCQEYDVNNFGDSGSNVMNSMTSALLMEFGAKSIVPSLELSLESLTEMAKNEFSQSDCILELPAYGKLRLMYSEHCPIGYNRSGCKACDSKVAFALKDRKNVSFPVICHKETCTVDILNGDCLCAPKEVSQISDLCSVRARLYFTDETVSEQVKLVDGFKILFEQTNNLMVEREVEKIRKVAVEIASARNHGLTKGHYQRGLH